MILHISSKRCCVLFGEFLRAVWWNVKFYIHTNISLNFQRTSHLETINIHTIRDNFIDFHGSISGNEQIEQGNSAFLGWIADISQSRDTSIYLPSPLSFSCSAHTFDIYGNVAECCIRSNYIKFCKWFMNILGEKKIYTIHIEKRLSANILKLRRKKSIAKVVI